MRKLTREEQLEYLIEFLEAQIRIYEHDLEVAKEELRQIRGTSNEHSL